VFAIAAIPIMVQNHHFLTNHPCILMTMTSVPIAQAATVPRPGMRNEEKIK